MESDDPNKVYPDQEDIDGVVKKLTLTYSEVTEDVKVTLTLTPEELSILGYGILYRRSNELLQFIEDDKAILEATSGKTDALADRIEMTQNDLKTIEEKVKDVGGIDPSLAHRINRIDALEKEIRQLTLESSHNVLQGTMPDAGLHQSQENVAAFLACAKESEKMSSEVLKIAQAERNFTRSYLERIRTERDAARDEREAVHRELRALRDDSMALRQSANNLRNEVNKLRTAAEHKQKHGGGSAQN
ncbi:hypothetical protein NKR23_g10310 [Pleurostoma richardsiae]|uniref:Uncharacterized protein n=1 Tax=Pleurostoma richardsiae TaxID=41990 RepID=A0AA38RDB0_9PEZI|nr:hypothetical protein NKR23_g10310 [Pleurostoma richardsiae]